MLLESSLALQYERLYYQNGGGWFLDLPLDKQREIEKVIVRLPFFIEVETANGLVGIVHAEVPDGVWDNQSELNQHKADVCLWSRSKIRSGDATNATLVNDKRV